MDRISELPDERVITLVSFLPLKEAAATSILSRRWKHVWKSSTSLNFDVKFGVGKPFLRFCRLEYEKMDQESRRYVNWVDSVMETHRAPTIKQFRVCFDIDCRFTTSVNRWIEFAMNKRVHTLQLEFYRETREDVYQFPHKILGLERESALKLSSDSSGTPSLDFCGCNIRFNFLKVLHFREVDVTQDVFEYFLSNCPVLERLTLDSAENLVTVRVAGPSFALKYLALINCFGLKSVL